MEDAQTLLRCLRWDAEGDERLAALDDQGWHALFAAVSAGRGHAILLRRLERAKAIPAPPGDIAAALAREQRRLAARGFATSALLLDRHDCVQKPILLLKGIDLAQRVYGGFGTRKMSDVDLLVHPGDAEDYHAALVSAGYVTDMAPTAGRRALALWSQAAYAPPSRRLYPVDLHWRLGKRDARAESNLDTPSIWSRAERCRAMGRDGILVMAREDLLLYLCLHMRHHGFDSPLTQVWDIAEVLDCSGTTFDWDAFWMRADAWRLSRTVRLAFHQAHTTLGIAIPDSDRFRLPDHVATLLPDVLPNLGRHTNHERVAEPVHRRPVCTIAGSRYAPARPFGQAASAAARGGGPLRTGAGLLRLVPAYVAYWVTQARNHGHFVGRWLRGDHTFLAQSDRVHRLSRWQEGDDDAA